MPNEAGLLDPTHWHHVRAALSLMADARRSHTPGAPRNPLHRGLLRSAARRGIASSEYAKVLADVGLKAELLGQLRGAA